VLHRIDPGKKRHGEFAKNLRKRQTLAERILWRNLRAKRFNGLKFRRQVPIGPYIADFMHVGAMIIVELDGASHRRMDRWEYDRVRDDYLRSWGFTVLRFSNIQVLQEKKEVLARIDAHIRPSP
jgi:very-short-patch-repair endonuclease